MSEMYYFMVLEIVMLIFVAILCIVINCQIDRVLIAFEPMLNHYRMAEIETVELNEN